MQDIYLRKLNIGLVDGEFPNLVQGQLRNPEQLFKTFQSLKDKAQETLIGVYLSDKLEIKLYDVLGLGDQASVVASSREIFGHAIITMSNTFALIHNHPKGDPTPSPADNQLIAELMKQSEIMHMKLLDFLVVGNDSYWSMFEALEGGEYSLGATY